LGALVAGGADGASGGALLDIGSMEGCMSRPGVGRFVTAGSVTGAKADWGVGGEPTTVRFFYRNGMADFQSRLEILIRHSFSRPDHNRLVRRCFHQSFQF